MPRGPWWDAILPHLTLHQVDQPTADTTKTWKIMLPSGTFRSLLAKLSLVLVRARVRNFDL
jgi:hypothetical protein